MFKPAVLAIFSLSLSLLLLEITPAYAGGGSVQPINFSHAQQISGKSFSPEVAIKDPATDYQTNLVGKEFSLQAQSSLPGAQCDMTKRISDSQGRIKANCRADAYGKFSFDLVDHQGVGVGAHFEVYFTENGSGFSDQGSKGAYSLGIQPGSFTTTMDKTYNLSATLKKDGQNLSNFDEVNYFRWEVLEGSIVNLGVKDSKQSTAEFRSANVGKAIIRVVGTMNDGSSIASEIYSVLAKRLFSSWRRSLSVFASSVAASSSPFFFFLETLPEAACIRDLNFSTRPWTSTNLCSPVKNGWHLLQISTMISSEVEPVAKTAPQEHVTFAWWFHFGWILAFIKITFVAVARYENLQINLIIISGTRQTTRVSPCTRRSRLIKCLFSSIETFMALSFDFQNQPISVGDTVAVYQNIVEGGKTRNQVFEGIVISIQNRQENKNFVVRKIATSGIGVEKIFPTLLPSITKIVIKRKGATRRSKLYYLRERIGQAASKLKEKKISNEQSNTKAATR